MYWYEEARNTDGSRSGSPRRLESTFDDHECGSTRSLDCKEGLTSSQLYDSAHNFDMHTSLPALTATFHAQISEAYDVLEDVAIVSIL